MNSRLSRCGVVALACLLAGCGHPQSMFAPAGPAAENLAHLGWFIFVLFSLVGIVMWVLLAWVASRRRGTFQEHAPVDAGGGHAWIQIGGFLIPFVILAVVFVAGIVAMSAFPLEGHMPMMAPADIRLVGHQWWWQVEYVKGPLPGQFITANEIHIPVGQPVDIDLTSADVIHSFFVPSLHGKVDLIPGQMNRIRIEAAQPGLYAGQCAEYCGAQHAKMRLLVVAELPANYEAWLARQIADAEPAVTGQEQRGAQLFQARACSLCHTVRGTPANGRVGPDLTHLASRHGLAANSLTNDTANLEAWVTHAQSLKPDAAMPNITEFKGDEIQALVAYLQQLR